MQSKAVIIAGANGAAKTTFAGRILPIDHPECRFLNADEIQRVGPAFSSPAAAGRELIRRLADQTALAQSFAIETTRSSAQHLRRIPQWHALGFQVWLYFLEVESADFSMPGVAKRVLAGGPRHSRG